jgi:4-hydroxybenzoyl-CoA reductase subunit beta
MGTVGGNLCLDTRCIYYNQSEWWRAANRYCLKYGGEICHVAPKSRICYATFSGDLSPALAILDAAEVEVAGAQGRRTLPLESLHTGDGERYLALEPDEFVVAVRARRPAGLRTGYDKVRVRQSIDYPLAGVAAGVVREGDRLADLRLAFTGTNPRPLRLAGTDALCGGPLDDAVMDRLSGLVRRQVMAMRTTFTSGHYRRHAAGVLARRLVRRLFDGG